MRNILNTLFKKNKSNELTDLTPRGIKSTIKSDNHGSTDDFNSTWIHIISQTRNIELFEKETGIKLK